MENKFKTLSQLLIFQAQNRNKFALNFKENGKWRNFSSLDFLKNSLYFACGLQGIGFEKNQKLAIYSYQNPIWLIVDFGVILAGGVSVPIFHNISKENLLFEIKEANCSYVFADNPNHFWQKNHFNKVEILQNQLPQNVKKVISYDFEIENGISYDEIIEIGRKKVLKNLAIAEFLKKLENDDFSYFSPENIFKIFQEFLFHNEKDLTTIIYTSGSTGTPKGVELSHENLVSQIYDAGDFFPLDKNSDKVLSFLPLAHIFERMVMMFYISRGVSIYFVDDVKNLGAYLQEVKPTLMTVVPRVLEKVYAKIKQKSQNANFLKKFLALKALQKALKKDVEKSNFLDKIYDILVYKKYRAALGGNMKMMICGGAALSCDMERFYRNININLFCGYGLTETSPVLAVNYHQNYRFQTVGKIFNSVQIKIADDGEILAKGKNIMIGYHKNHEKTQEVIIDGWLHTGDLGAIDKDGFLKITGRKKELFKTANGKYVRPIPIEQKLVQEIGFLIGALIIAENRNFVSTLLFVDFELLAIFKKKFGFDCDDLEFLQSEFLKKFVQEKIDEINEILDRSEQLFKFKIIEDEISIEGGEITPSMKLKRTFLEKKYQNFIDKFYEEII